MGSSSAPGASYDYTFKVLLIGDSGVGKSSLLVSFISNHVDDLTPTIGVDFKIKQLKVAGKRLKLTIWDTVSKSGSLYSWTGKVQNINKLLLQRCSRNHSSIDGLYLTTWKLRLIISYQLVFVSLHIAVYDVTRRESFTNLSDVWAKEIELYSTNPDCIKVLVGNKVDKESERMVTREEGIALAKEYGCVFLECSAKTRENVEKCFDELALKILEVPSLLEEGSAPIKRTTLTQKQQYNANPGGSCCS
ncbi:hypothetical protein Taro_051841 [Colocasia esculenta]|uniref:Ras-related protein RABC2a n=1 Tax=Colocasia esculenta TaxID=4460 RepID=A0A843XI87_COLES|nr:hypothetical protein [Colocasia esculenta]